jgi:putative tryptophan/tyrosine transport system substrate-binding protein
MRRREFLSLAGSAVATWPFAARAQRSAANTPVVTLINARKADTATALAAEFRKGLDQAGLTEGKDVVVEYHWLDGRYDELAAILNDAIRRHVAVIATPANWPVGCVLRAPGGIGDMVLRGT